MEKVSGRGDADWIGEVNHTDSIVLGLALCPNTEEIWIYENTDQATKSWKKTHELRDVCVSLDALSPTGVTFLLGLAAHYGG